ncbi:winged helix DNA-binding protein [Sphingomonas sp. Leaf25]|uniref:winged helix DNA-binding protein n=1 Tax=Sphingomonas sp. Leaf25 TaxID=1735692 RepID=UPI0006F7FC92|nr:winged helix DNA-binding protein [Sphingomonas sp. Leaf25]KQN00318.1 hypothetical protein ASE78_04105 [Sphingomonas sp. Leaf25]
MGLGFDGFSSGATDVRRAIVIAFDRAGGDMAVRAAAHGGVQVVATITSGDDVAAALDGIAHADLHLIETAGAGADLLDTVLPVLRERAVRDRARMVVAFGAEQIDTVTLHLLGGPADLLCDAGLSDRVAAIALGRAAVGGVQDRDPDSERLRRLNEEVARIAEVLARLARGEGDAGGSVRDRSKDYAAPPPAGVMGTVTAAEVRGAIRARRLRGQYLPAELFADPAWDMLLDLFAAWLERTQVSVSSLCIAAAVPPTTALRWIGTLVDAGLVERRDDPADRRRAFIVLTARAVAGMNGYAGAVASAGLGWA